MPMAEKTLQALLFDVDGTLADTERDGHRVAFNRAFRDAGLDWNWDVDLYGKLLAVTGGKERIRHFLDEFHRDFPRPADLDDFIAALHRTKTDHYTRLLAEGQIPLRPGIERLLREARNAGLRLAIATTTTPANVEALITHTLGADALDWFEVIAAGDIVPAKKPAPDIFVWALEQMNLAPEAALAFEDSGNGIRASVGAGLPTVVTINDYTRDHDFDAALLVLDHLGEPDLPARLLTGPETALGDKGYLTVDDLQRLHAAAS